MTYFSYNVRDREQWHHDQSKEEELSDKLHFAVTLNHFGCVVLMSG